MELIDNKAVKITVPNDTATRIQGHISKASVTQVRGDFADVLVYWGLDEMIKLNELVIFKKPLPSPMFGTINGQDAFIRSTTKK
jgi:hypothetical protein